MQALKISFYVYPLVNAAHIMAIGAVVTSAVVMDLRILGLPVFIEREPLLKLMREIVATAFPVAALTGLALFSVRAQEYATNPAFLAKMALLALAGVNLLAYRKLTAVTAAGAPVPAAARTLAALSILIWTAVLVAGRFIGFI